MNYTKKTFSICFSLCLLAFNCVLRLQMTLVEGNVAASGGFAFVSQQGWILNDSLKENILFGNQYDKERSAISYCVTMQDKKQC